MSEGPPDFGDLVARLKLSERDMAEAARLKWSVEEYARYLRMDDRQREAFRDEKVRSHPDFQAAEARRRRRQFRVIPGGAS